MRKSTLAIVAGAVLSLAACTDQEMSDFNSVMSAIPVPTPEEQCSLDNGTWQTATVYDPNGNAIGATGTCVQTVPPPDAPRHRK